MLFNLKPSDNDISTNMSYGYVDEPHKTRSIHASCSLKQFFVNGKAMHKTNSTIEFSEEKATKQLQINRTWVHRESR